ncbi:hypothetical protein SAMN05216466_102108 [Paraburkholderia phenazinium]|jgi:hypothetical protein|uniref:Metal ABC transporter ATPase n=2 Tax=Paraburkholderia phenazinium TaxID=60549 RepID=A0A1G7RH90_9BURK|nr:hypothetical protein [Paraburkholderia phenazinium]SDG10147.1 hypothetical protein SAMN05216466_102108 [Paraburkholderia phenazinium]
MGIHMQITYVGFAGSAQIESAAAVQFVRLERFGHAIAGCHLAIEALRERPALLARVSAASADAIGGMFGPRLLFDARLDLIARDGDLVPVEHCMHADPNVAVRTAFDKAERQLECGAVGARH